MSDFLNSSPSRHIDPELYNDGRLGNDKEKSTRVLPPPSATTPPPSNSRGYSPFLASSVYNDQVISYSSTPTSKLINGVLANLGADGDYGLGLNLTPFLTHNLNVYANSNTNSAGAPSMTPFYDKSLHLTDFFIDTPIKLTPFKDVGTITPSKFKFGSDKKTFKQSIFHDPRSAQKRSITELDTPQRHSSVVIKDLAKETPSRPPLKETNKTVFNAQNTNTDTTTPSKRLVETPKAPAPVSSPSTLIMSSAVRSPPASEKRQKTVPASPTPQKTAIDESLKPRMGVFSEKTKRPDYRPPLQKNKVMKNRSQMQAGMNKFQIVFTDVQSLVSNKKKKQKKKRDDSPDVHNAPMQPMYMYPQNHVIHQARPIQPPPPASLQPGMSDSKENSVNNAMNTSHLNLSASTDHTSFEIAGQHASTTTPNGKYFLDKVFEKPSPANHGQYVMQGYHNMPPPPAGSRPPTYHDMQQGPMVMMMSTPQHQNVVNYPVPNNESSPDDEYFSQMVPVMGANGQPILVPMRYDEKQS